MPWNQTTSRITGFAVTAAVWNDEIVENFEFLEEVAYAQFVADVSITATTGATANTVIASSTLTYEAVPHLLEFSTMASQPQATSGARITYVLYDGATEGEHLGYVQVPAAASMLVPTHLKRRFTPTAASHTYTVKAFTSSGTATVHAGAGGAAATEVPGYIRITRVPTS